MKVRIVKDILKGNPGLRDSGLTVGAIAEVHECQDNAAEGQIWVRCLKPQSQVSLEVAPDVFELTDVFPCALLDAGEFEIIEEES